MECCPSGSRRSRATEGRAQREFARVEAQGALYCAAMPPPPLRELTAPELRRVSASTIGHYEQTAAEFWQGTKDHDVSQNLQALLRHIRGVPPFFPPGPRLWAWAGPGAFRELGHEPVGLDGAANFVAMARAHTGCEVWQQDLLRLELPPAISGILPMPCCSTSRVKNCPGYWASWTRAGKRRRAVRFQPTRTGSRTVAGGTLRHVLELASVARHRDRAASQSSNTTIDPREGHDHEQPWLASVWRKRDGADGLPAQERRDLENVPGAAHERANQTRTSRGPRGVLASAQLDKARRDSHRRVSRRGAVERLAPRDVADRLPYRDLEDRVSVRVDLLNDFCDSKRCEGVAVRQSLNIAHNWSVKICRQSSWVLP